MSKNRIVMPNRCYHLVSRVAHRAFFFDAEEKRRFVEMMMRAAFFSGVKLLGWCVMSNHFHILIFLPEEQPLTDEQVLERVKGLYRGPQLLQAVEEWNELKKEADEEIAAGVSCGSRFEDLKIRLRNRMFHPGEFMKTLKQYVTTSFNGRRRHYGTLWENRYRVRITKPVVREMSRQLAYIDCNPCEAGVCGNPADYEWCGWHSAVAGDEAAREMYRFVYCGEAARFENVESEMTWDDVVTAHEQAIRNRIGEISNAKAAGEESDWMFVERPDYGNACIEADAQPVAVIPEGRDMHPPEKRIVQLERGKGATAERILSIIRASGEMSAGEILEAVGIASRPFLLSVYLKPMVAQGFLSLSMPDKPSSRHQKYRITQVGRT